MKVWANPCQDNNLALQKMLVVVEKEALTRDINEKHLNFIFQILIFPRALSFSARMRTNKLS